MSSINDFNQTVIEEFRANNGVVGGGFAGAPVVLLHTTGAKSGSARVNPLVALPRDDGTLYVFASANGAPTMAPPPKPMIARPVAMPGWSGNHLMSVETGEM